MADPPQWPHALRAALDAPPLERKAWSASLAPSLIGLFLGVVFFDQIPAEGLGPGGIVWPVLGLALGGLLSYLLLYRSPAMWGMSTGRPLGVIATSTFGIRGATWIPGLLVAGTGVVWVAVSTEYATRLTLRSLVLFRLLDPTALGTIRVGGVETQGALFLFSSLVWCYAVAFVGRYLVRVIAALMAVYPVVPAALLGVSTILAFRGLRDFQAVAASGGGPFRGDMQTGALAARLTVQMVFGFFAAAGLTSADWGVAVRDARDVKAGGWVGVAFASWVVATLSILSVAGAMGSGNVSRPLNYVEAVEILTGGRLAGSMLMALGLCVLAQAVFASYLFATRLNDTFPRVSRTRWTALGAGVAWLLIGSGMVGRLFVVFSLLGGIVAPASGAIAADYVRSRGNWPGARSGYNAPGLIAWFLGAVVGVAPTFAGWLGVPWLRSMQPAAVFGFVAAFSVYWVTSGLGSKPAEVDPRFESVPKSDTPWGV